MRNVGDVDGVNVGVLDGVIVGALRPGRFEIISIRIMLKTDNLMYHILNQPA